MNLKELNLSVLGAQTFVNYYHSRDAHPGIKTDLMTMCVGTLDMALSRFNTALLRCQQHPLIADQYRTELKECVTVINRFYDWTLRLKNWSRWLIWIPIFMLDWIGKRHVPKIKKLHDSILTTLNDSN
jgi:hypothetical protein